MLICTTFINRAIHVCQSCCKFGLICYIFFNQEYVAYETKQDGGSVQCARAAAEAATSQQHSSCMCSAETACQASRH